jgi:YD repeat-containing protein
MPITTLAVCPRMLSVPVIFKQWLQIILNIYALGILLIALPTSAYAGLPPVVFNYVNNTGDFSFGQADSPEAACTAAMAIVRPNSSNAHYSFPEVNGVDLSSIGMTNFYCSFEDEQKRKNTYMAGYPTCGPYETRMSTRAYIDSVTWTCVCRNGDRFMENTQRCETLTAASVYSDEDKSLGSTCDRSCGEPINPGTGNMWHVETDYWSASIGGMTLTRTYNSLAAVMDADIPHTMGVRWTHAYETALRAEAAVQSGKNPGQCWRLSATSPIRCERKAAPVTAVPEAVSISRADGKRYYFNRVGQAYIAAADISDRIEPTYSADGKVSAWTYKSALGDVTERYSAAGQLLSITNRNGLQQRLTYSGGQTNDTRVSRQPDDAPVCTHVQSALQMPAGRLMCVTDHWGRQLQFEYDLQGRITKLIDPENRETTYEYDGPSGGCTPGSDSGSAPCKANNLTKVTYPDRKDRTYWYNELPRIYAGTCTEPKLADGFGHLISAMTGLVDENGARHISWEYNCAGNATSSQRAEGVERVEVLYQFASSAGTSSVVTHVVGDPAAPKRTQSTFNYKLINRRMRDVGSTAQCVECGAFSARTFDANGNVATTTDWNGNTTRHTYDFTRNLELTRLDAAGTALERQSTTEWHPTFRLPMKVAEPKRLTSYKRDATGNVLTRTEQATTDNTGKLAMAAPLTGSARVWTYTYNPSGQIESIRGPRTDIADLTRYSYDAQGNLSTVTDALQRVTTMNAYDANGRVGRIETPDGVVTTYDYDARGRILAKTVRAGSGAEVTRLDYDGVGQLKKVILPDNSIVTYDYDDAHRLIGIGDALGNRIDYVLDLTGNQLQEKTLDPNGALARQVSRAFNTLGMLIQQSGRPQ